MQIFSQYHRKRVLTLIYLRPSNPSQNNIKTAYFTAKYSVDLKRGIKASSKSFTRLYIKMVLNKKLTIPTVCELFQLLLTIKKDWSVKSPLEKWSYIYGIGRAANAIVKLPMYDDDQTLSLWAYQGCVYFGAYFVLGVYTVFYFLMSGEFAKCLPCTCLLVGPVLGVSFKC